MKFNNKKELKKFYNIVGIVINTSLVAMLAIALDKFETVFFEITNLLFFIL